MKLLRLILCLLFFVPGCSILGGWAAMDAHRSPWFGLILGAGAGALFGSIFGGAVHTDSWIANLMYGPTDPNAVEEEES